MSDVEVVKKSKKMDYSNHVKENEIVDVSFDPRGSGRDWWDLEFVNPEMSFSSGANALNSNESFLKFNEVDECNDGQKALSKRNAYYRSLWCSAGAGIIATILFSIFWMIIPTLLIMGVTSALIWFFLGTRPTFSMNDSPKIQIHGTTVKKVEFINLLNTYPEPRKLTWLLKRKYNSEDGGVEDFEYSEWASMVVGIIQAQPDFDLDLIPLANVHTQKVLDKAVEKAERDQKELEAEAANEAVVQAHRKEIEQNQILEDSDKTMQLALEFMGD